MVKFKGFGTSLFVLLATIACQTKEPTQFQLLTSSETGVSFTNVPASSDKLGILYYINYYSGAGVASADFNNDGLIDLYFAANNHAGNKLYINKGNFKFEDITEKAGVAGNADWCSGVTVTDINADGWMDIYVCAVSKKHGLTGRNELFINNKNNTFSEKAAEYGLDFTGYSTQAAFFDYDHDGDLDCYLLNQSSHPHQNIVDTSFRRKHDTNAGDILFRNDMNGPSHKFIDASVEAGIYQSFLGFGLGLAVADVNNDGWEDIYIGNDFHENDYYYVNNKNGTFSESGAKVFNHYSRFSMGNDISDFDNDGNLDIITVDMLPPDESVLKTYGSDERVDVYNFKIINKGYQAQFSRNCLQRNNGDGKNFSEIGLAAGVSATDWSWSPLMADFNNDGFKDIFVASGIVKRTADLDYVRFVMDLSREKSFNSSPDMDQRALDKMPDGASDNFMFTGNGQGSFTDISLSSGIGGKKGYYTGASYADLDNDGDLDLVVNAVSSPAAVYRNNQSARNYIQIEFKGESLNTKGIGAKAYVFQKGKLQYQQLMLTRGFQSSSFERLHFGLDSIATIDSLLIVWPDAKFEIIKSPSVNKKIIVDKKNAAGQFDQLTYFPPSRQLYQSVESPIVNGWKHRESIIEDFNQQYLIPHALSIRGPKLAIADINKDGLEDFYVCGALNQTGQLFVQNNNGKFLTTDSAVFAQDLSKEDVDAVFLDANGDGWQDLYVVSGGNYYRNGSPELADRLYLNNGKGHFEKSVTGIPSLLTNKSCVIAEDFDGDKDTDLFVGSLADPLDYGIAQTSYLLVNDGRGHFTPADKNTINLDKIGMVTAAAAIDVNKDGLKDIVVTGEWMPLTVFIQKDGKFTGSVLPSSSGLWQSLFVADINNDGFEDLLAGNWGLNSKLAAGKTPPLKLYLRDFDNNGKRDPIMAYTIGKVEYPFLPKDEVEQAIPLVKKRFLFYTDYAGKPIASLFEVAPDDCLKLQADELASCSFTNDGKGGFIKTPLPFGYQLTPLFAFQKGLANDQWLAGGNFFGVLPYEGQYDATTLMSFQTSNGLNFTQPQIFPDLKGQVRDLKWLNTKNGKLLVVARNNSNLVFYSANP